MRKLVIIPAIAILLSIFTFCDKKSEKPKDRMDWWRDARFGMFIHWGLYSVPAGEWKGSANHAEWIRTTAEIPLEEYEKFVDQFNPEKFNAEEFVKMAKDAGMKYIVITTKHHDGFCLFDSKETEFDIMSTPFKRDIMKEMADACKKYDIKMCWYHSIMDWHHPDYLPRRDWEKSRSSEGADLEKYITYMKNQLKELLTNYGNIGVLWFDGEWENTWNHERGKDLYNYVLGLQSDIIINNRVDVSRAGLNGMSKDESSVGDFGTPEQEIPATGIPGKDWESCMTMNDHWGYNKNDKNFKSSEDLIRKLIDIASKGGNFLLNIGPTSEGLFPQESIDRLKEIGSWMKLNSEAIYGTKASPFKNLTWGRCTEKEDGDNTLLYMHVFDWPNDAKLLIPGLENEVEKAYALADAGKSKLNVTKADADVIIDINNVQKNNYATVIVLEVNGKPVVYESPEISSENKIFTDKISVKMSTKIPQAEIRFTTDGSDPSVSSEIAKEITSIQMTKSFTLKAKCFKNGKAISGSAIENYEFVTLLPTQVSKAAKPGLKYTYYHGKWEKMPDFSIQKPVNQGNTKNIDITLKKQPTNYGLVFEGFIKAPAEGIYTLFIESDDGSKLVIDDKIEITNDGLHGMVEKSADAALSAGYHKIKVLYFQQEGGDGLKVYWKGPGIEKVQIPDNYMYY